MVKINEEQCRRIGRQISGYQIKPEFYKREFLTFDADRETKMRVYFLSAAICHQTRTLYHPKLNLHGWDYLEYGFLQLVKKRNPLLNPGYISICTDNDIAGLLAETFSPTGKKEDCTLDRLGERSIAWLSICNFVKKNFQGSISRMIDASQSKLLNDGNGLYEKLPELPAFRDPEKKKITFFLKLATDAGILQIKDTENLVPIMDYHMQRVMLRTGCVEIDDPELEGNLRSRKILPSDEPVRTACIGAMKIISNESKAGILKLNDYFWPLGRSCCGETTLCRDHKCMKDPCSLAQMVEIQEHDKCILQPFCKGATNDEYLELWEPMVETHYY